MSRREPTTVRRPRRAGWSGGGMVEEARALTGWLKRLRRTRDLTQAQLAGRLGYSEVAVRKIEAGAARPSQAFAESLLALLAVPPARHEEFVRFVRGPAWAAGEALPAWLEDLAAYGGPPGRSTNLPTPLDPLVGREGEVAAVRERLLRPGDRVLTLTGPGGVGKTRLALAAATLVIDRFADGVVFVSLAVLRDPGLVPSAIAHALEVQEEPGRSVEQSLARALRDRHLLLVLDNFEQLVAAAPLLTELLGAAREVKALVTSRQALRLRGEQEFRVPPLTLPPPGAPLPLAQLAEVPAVALFVQRARAAAPDFALTDESAPVVAEVCRRLDGLPLALELAAARTRLLTAHALRARLERCLPLLTGGARDLPSRQRTLRATIDWSYELLTPKEQALFARLAVFAGGCTLEAAEAVCGEIDAPAPGRIAAPSNAPMDVLEGLQSLDEKSLVRHDESAPGEPRFAMLDTVHEYALERLEASGESEAVRHRHAAHFAGLAERARAGLKGPAHAEWLERLEREQDNIRHVLRWAIGRGDAELALRLAGGLAWFWGEWAQVSEGRQWLTAALALTAAAEPSAARARALGELANFASEQGDWDEAEALHGDVLAMWQALDDQLEIASRLEGLGLLRLKQGDPAAAAALFEESLALNQRFGNQRHISNSLNLLGLAKLDGGEADEARRLIEQGKAIDTAEKNTAGVGNALSTLGLLYEEQGDYARALSSYKESLAIREALHHRTAAARARLNVAEVVMLQGHVDRAWALYIESLTVLRAQGDRLNMARCLEGLAVLAANQEAPERALRLAGAGAALRGAAPVGARRKLAGKLESALAVARAALGVDAAERAYQKGWELPLAEAIEEAMVLHESLVSPAPWNPAPK